MSLARIRRALDISAIDCECGICGMLGITRSYIGAEARTARPALPNRAQSAAISGNVSRCPHEVAHTSRGREGCQILFADRLAKMRGPRRLQISLVSMACALELDVNL